MIDDSNHRLLLFSRESLFFVSLLPLPWVPEVFFFFTLGADLSGEAAIASRKRNKQQKKKTFGHPEYSAARDSPSSSLASRLPPLD